MAVTILDSECQLLLLRSDVLTSKAAKFLNLVCEKLSVPIHVCDNQLIDAASLSWIERRLATNSESKRRSRLLVAGGYLEEQITVSAMHALALGYEVFLLKDFIATRTIDHLQAFDMRLFQAGVVPTTLHQLLYEWLSQEEVSERQSVKRSLLELIDFESGRPA
jgi:Isochorismatase family